MGDLLVGLDVGGTKIHGVLLRPDGVVAREHRAPTVRGPEGVTDGAAQAVRALVAAEGLDVADIVGVGIGVPGLVEPDAGVVRHAVNLGVGEEPFDLGARVSAALGGLGVAVENDLNAAALGAAALLDGVGGDLAYLSLGTGAAAGLVLDGRLRRGVHGTAGEIGHLPIDPEGPECPCGQRGCLEQYISGSAIARVWPTKNGDPPAVEMFAAAAWGDPRAVELRERFVNAVADAVQMLSLTLDVGVVVIGGGVAALGDHLLAPVRRRLEAREAASPFLASAGLAGRVRIAPTDVPIAAVGAALAYAGGQD